MGNEERKKAVKVLEGRDEERTLQEKKILIKGKR